MAGDAMAGAAVADDAVADTSSTVVSFERALLRSSTAVQMTEESIVFCFSAESIDVVFVVVLVDELQPGVDAFVTHPDVEDRVQSDSNAGVIFGVESGFESGLRLFICL